MILCLLVFLIALLYASVGHGGASGYLAVLSLWGVPAEQMAASALILNLGVSGVALRSFARAGHFSWRLTGPFVLLSIPAAWLGGFLKVSPGAYDGLLAGVLFLAAWRLWVPATEASAGRVLPSAEALDAPRLAIALPAGAGAGFLSGVVGIGGGIFLSPLLIFKRWANPKQAAATSAFFILVNSAAGLLGRAGKGPLVMGPIFWLILAALLGAAAGARLGSDHFSGRALKRVLACVLVLAALRSVAT